MVSKARPGTDKRFKSFLAHSRKGVMHLTITEDECELLKELVEAHQPVSHEDEEVQTGLLKKLKMLSTTMKKNPKTGRVEVWEGGKKIGEKG
jgi:hypothetical protein